VAISLLFGYFGHFCYEFILSLKNNKQIDQQFDIPPVYMGLLPCDFHWQCIMKCHCSHHHGQIFYVLHELGGDAFLPATYRDI
jgi:hypothetical protein